MRLKLNSIKMKAPALGLLWLAFAPAVTLAQWTGGPTGTIYYNGGNIGMGTTSPGSGLANAAFGTNLHVAGSGNTTIAIQSTNAAAALLAQGAGQGTMALADVTQASGYKILDIISAGGKMYFRRIADGYGSALAFPMTIDYTANSQGNVGIGTTNPAYKLAVEGAIGARDIIVTNAPWSDYVFRPDYRLRPLSEVNAFIQQHGHLPDIPSEAAVKNDGVSMAEMQAKLLAKIEELTLYLLSANQRIERLESELAKENQ